MQLVVNEWFLEFLVPNVDLKKINKVNSFIRSVNNNSHILVIGHNNSFTNKFYKYMKIYGWDIDFKNRFQKIRKLLFYDSLRTLIIDESELAILSEEIVSITPADDLYLVELAFSTEDKVIITTDNRLKEALNKVPELSIVLLDDFLKETHRGRTGK